MRQGCESTRRELVDGAVVWQDAVPDGMVVTTLDGERYVTRIMQDSNLDGWEDSAATLRRARVLHVGFVAMARGRMHDRTGGVLSLVGECA